MDTTWIETFENRKEFVGASSVEADFGEEFSFDAASTEDVGTVLLPVVIQLESPIPAEQSIASMLWKHGGEEDDNQAPSAAGFLATSEQDHDGEHFRIFPLLGVMIGKFTPASLALLLDSQVIKAFSWDMQRYVFHKRMGTDANKEEVQHE